jgi:hypothetical protein
MAPSKKKAGNSGAGPNEVGLGKRLIVILYAAGIVAIGAYPIQREFGSVYNFLDIKLRQYANTGLLGETTASSKAGRGLSQFFRSGADTFTGKTGAGKSVKGKTSPEKTQSGRARLSDPEIKRLRVGSGTAARNALESDMDHIDSSDKAALDKLIVEKAQ